MWRKRGRKKEGKNRKRENMNKGQMVLLARQDRKYERLKKKEKKRS